MKILVFGGSGFLGSEIIKILKQKKLGFLAPSSQKADVLTLQMENLVRSYQPDFILNCVAFTAVDNAEAEVERAYALNAEVPKRLAQVAHEVGARLVHFSTDFVFDGRQESGYTESDLPKPLSVYGKSKRQGEKNIQEVDGKYWIIRTSFPFGDDPKCFLQKILTQIESGRDLKVVDGFVCSPTAFAELAERVVEMLPENLESGIYHLTNFGACSRYEFAREVLRILKRKNKIEPTAVLQTGTTAERPLHSALLNTKLPEMKPWTTALANYLKSKI